MLVEQVIAVDRVMPAAQVVSGEVAERVLDAAAGDIQAVQLVERRRGVLDEMAGVEAKRAPAAVAAGLRDEIAEQDLAGQREIGRASCRERVCNDV